MEIASVLLLILLVFNGSYSQVESCSSGSLRLVDGLNQYEGRVEVCLNNQWGTVCDDFWGDEESKVVCRQLGFSTNGAKTHHFLSGLVPILMDNVMCSGNEIQLIDCRYDTVHNCLHAEDVGVICSNECQDGDVRLVNGSSSSEGRVEICFNGVWGTVCDDLWDTVDATVVCKQLGLAYTDVAVMQYGQGSGSIFLDNVACLGTENSLASCPYDNHTSDCSHSEDAGVRCRNCSQGDVRLVDGMSAYQGRVEVCLRGQWGTVCDDFWGNVDAGVVCGQLGFSRYNAIGKGAASYGQGTGLIHLDDVSCTGNELRLLDCSYNSRHNCFHSEDAGVTCNVTKVCMNGDIRLNGNNRAYFEGRVEICWNEIWGTVCDSGWSLSDAQVACYQLGYSRQAATPFTGVLSSALFGEGPGSSPILLQLLRCRGNESKLVNCRHSGVGQVSSMCGHSRDAGVRCGPAPCQNGNIRLVGGVSPYEGRVEVCLNGAWGTVCDDFWDVNDATVVCRQLGFNTPLQALSFGNAYFGEGSGFILLDDVGCSGTEEALLNCSYSNHNCGHSEDASVRCPQCTEHSIRLRDGPTAYEGRVEVCLGGGWGTVCDDGWSPYDAIVTCRQLGFSTTGARAVPRAAYGQGNLTIAMDNVRCNSRESRLTDCPYLNATEIRSCTHAEDAGVVCSPLIVGPPQSVSISNVQPTSFILSWTLPSSSERHWDITGFMLNCSNQDGYPLWRRNITGNSTLSLNVTNLEEYTEYRCCVAATTSAHISMATCTVSRTSQAAPSSPPINFRVTGVTSRALSLQWDEPVLRHRNGIILRYQVNLVARETSHTYEVFTRSVTVTSLHPYYTYNCTVSAITVAPGPSSSVISVQTYQDVPSGPPSSVTITDVTSNSITMNISKPLLEHQNGIILSYFITLTHTPDVTSTNYTILVGELFTVSGLSPYTVYTYVVAAATINGTGPYSRSSRVTTNQTAPSRAPTIALSVQNSTTLRVSWNPIPRQYRNGIIDYYQIMITEVETNMQSSVNYLRSPATLFSLHPYYRYKIKVAAFTVALGPYSITHLVRMPTDIPSVSPSNVMVTTLSRTSFSLTWNQIPDRHRNGIITGYIVRLSYSGGATIYQNTTNKQTTFSDLTSNRDYFVSVAGRNSAGIGPFSEILIFNAVVTVPESPPRNVRVSSVTSRSLVLSWATLRAEEWNGNRGGFILDIVELKSNRSIITRNISTTSSVISSLHPSYSYLCKIAAYNSAGTGPFSSIMWTLPEDVPDISPPNFTATYTASRPTSVTLKWMSIPSEYQNGDITGYNLTVTPLNGNGQVQKFSLEPSLLSYNVSSLTPNAQYTISIFAKTSVGGGPASSIQISVLPKVPSVAPMLGDITRISATEIHARWNEVSTGNIEVDTYHVKYGRLQTNQRRSIDNEIIITKANETSTFLSNLDPESEYGVSVAASNRAGRGSYSPVVTVGLFDGSMFQIQMTGSVVCSSWLLHDHEKKLNAILGEIVNQLIGSCSCNVSLNYLLRSEFSCGNEISDPVVLQGTLIRFRNVGSTTLHAQLQTWVDTSPSVEIIGVTLKILPCSTYSGSDTCTQTSSSTVMSVTDSEQSSSSSFNGIPIYASIVLVLLVFITTVVIVVVVLKKKQGKLNRGQNQVGIFDSGIPNQQVIVETDVDPKKIDFGGDEEHIYEEPNFKLYDVPRPTVPDIKPELPPTYNNLHHLSEDPRTHLQVAPKPRREPRYLHLPHQEPSSTPNGTNFKPRESLNPLDYSLPVPQTKASTSMEASPDNGRKNYTSLLGMKEFNEYQKLQFGNLKVHKEESDDYVEMSPNSVKPL